MARERGCRVCGKYPFEWAHIAGREYDARDGRVHPDDIVPLCGPFPAGHHGAYDAEKSLDLVPYLTPEEIARAVHHLGPGLAARRLRNSRDPEPLPSARPATL